jgi:uncharacterized damage-inducible protein DinB
MSITLRLEKLIDYSDHERDKWREWIAADSARLQIPFQPGGRFPTLASLLDHIFLVERRHLARLEGGTPPETTGVAAGNWEALFEYASLVRADFRRYVASVDAVRADEMMEFSVSTGPCRMTRRKLALHIVLHETRHLAQAALAVRTAGLEPPGNHDLFYFTEFA